MQGFNKYYPPNWTPEDGNLNKFNGKHALGDRARKLDKGILIVRFELPFNIWCDTCNNHIGMGVRYNAEKSKVGMYYTTPILNFRCKCHLCSAWFEIRTDPQNTRYVVHSGARQKNEEWDPAENGTLVLSEKPDESAPPDPFAALEKTVVQKTKALSDAQHLYKLEELSSSRWSDPYAASVALRSAFRKEKKVRVESDGRAEGVKGKYALGDRVRMEDLKTPAREVKEVEDVEWEEAKRERERRDAVRLGKRKRELDQVGWVDDASSSSSTKKRRHSSSTSTSTSTSKARLSSSSSTAAPTSSSQRRPIKSLPSRSLSKPPTSAVRNLASKVLLNSALKSDPFARSGSSVSGGRNKPGLSNGSGASVKMRKSI